MSIQGKIILNTRPSSESEKFNRQLKGYGAEVINFPMIEIQAKPVNSELEEKLKALGRYNGLIFTSRNAVRSFFQIMERGSIQYKGEIFCVGERTSEEVRKFGYKATTFSNNSGANGLIENLSSDKYRGFRFLYLRGNLTLNDIKGAVRNVEEVTVYSNEKPSGPENLREVKELLDAKRIDCIAFFSPSAVRNFLEFVPEFKQDGIRIAAIGKTTSRFAESRGLRVDIIPDSQTGEDLGEAIMEFYNSMEASGRGYEIRETAAVPERIKGESCGSIFIRACFSQPVERTPIWIMRQAGRYLPEYKAIREKYDFITMCRTPELASEVTLQPVRRFGFDAGIIFSDILVVPDAMGMKLRIVESHGPQFEKRITSADDIYRLDTEGLSERLDYVFKAISMAKRCLNGTPLIGFSGSPWTLAAYMLEGRSSRDFGRARAFIRSRSAEAHVLLQKLCDSVIEYLRNQIRAGCDAIQIFDTWAGILPPADFEEFSSRYLKHIIDNLRTERVPIILFAKGISNVKRLRGLECDVLGVDWTQSLSRVKREAGGIAVQGNLRPEILLTDPDTIRIEAGKVLEDFGWGNGHIFNLGHGILPTTPVEHVKVLVDFVKEESRKYHIPIS